MGISQTFPLAPYMTQPGRFRQGSGQSARGPDKMQGTVSPVSP